MSDLFNILVVPEATEHVEPVKHEPVVEVEPVVEEAIATPDVYLRPKLKENTFIRSDYRTKTKIGPKVIFALLEDFYYIIL